MLQKRSISPPSAPATRQMTISKFLGVDTVHAEDEISILRASDMRNLVRTKIGEFGKRPGIRQEGVVPSGRITDSFYIDKHLFAIIEKQLFYRKGQTFEKVEGTEVFESDKPLHLYHGEKLYVFDTTGIRVVETDTETPFCKYNLFKKGLFSADEWFSVNSPYLNEYNVAAPVCVVGSRPRTGGGTTNEQVNLFSPFITESFCVTSEDLTGDVCKRFQLSTTGQTIVKLDDTKQRAIVQSDIPAGNATEWLNHSLKVEVMVAEEVQTSGQAVQQELQGRRVYWKTLELTDKDFLNPQNGGVWFHDGIGVSPIEGEDNVRITYLRNRDQAMRDIMTLLTASAVEIFGVGGHRDRVFYAKGRKIYYSNMDSPLTVGAENYVEVGLPEYKDIVTLGTLENYLAALCKDGAYLINGVVGDEGGAFVQEAIFAVSSRITAPAPTGKSGIVTFGGERCYLSKQGIVALTGKDATEERYAQVRSGFINHKLLREDLTKCSLTVWEDFLLISTENDTGTVYVLDEKQPISISEEPYSARQYEGYIWDGIHAQHFVSDADNAMFINNNLVMVLDKEQRFDELETGQRVQIDAWWLTPCFNIADFKRRKLITRYGLGAGCSDMSVEIWYKKNNREWKCLRGYDNKLRKFSYQNFDYAQFVYQKNPLLLLFGKARIKKAYCTQFVFRNNRIYEDMRLQNFGFDYVQEN